MLNPRYKKFLDDTTLRNQLRQNSLDFDLEYLAEEMGLRSVSKVINMALKEFVDKKKKEMKMEDFPLPADIEVRYKKWLEKNKQKKTKK